VRADAKVQPTERSGEVDQGSVRSGSTGNEAPRGHMTTNAPLKQGQDVCILTPNLSFTMHAV
jgi:hypothetical protein